ncbi:Type II secretory pathway, component ExeA (predicted ATPase) [Malonomonas rubra DSM 5091]|uniref:Type II secretory pathway, component ExeA (Predicted ATPase) n=1 Tax=Malonomonas rubra DSM 5091 TaxID=1122189 RepID=A0A1M6DG51_MALRU|nr:AAA family ATPase [Malonomonas rubra]SHI72093.1 Type II secretory pathway, component ExeA (predicted ATPase) [Malonomonas rubra DSM 5091]
MYKSFYGLRTRPFAKTPDPQFLFLSRSHREALARMLHAVEERDMVLLTGGIGCGKTTLSRALMDELGENYRIVLLTNPRMSPLEFLQALALRLGIEPPADNKSELLEQLGTQLYQLYQQQVHPVLIVDEAQLIPHKDVFDEIRLLTNYQLDDVNLISVILLGQPELVKRLGHQVYEPLRQRIGIQFNLKPLASAEVADYLKHRLVCSGGDENLFSADAAEKIAQISAGIPRRINQLASLALLEGFGRGVRQIDAAVIAAVEDELEGL